MEFHRERQIKYFQRCYNTVLPAAYTSMDSNRLFLGFFIVAGLDLLSAPSSTSSAAPAPLVPLADRRHLRAWVLAQQHRLGGFCGSPSQVQPGTVRRGFQGGASQPAVGDPENISLAGTFFALILLGTLAEEDEASLGQAYRQVNRVATLRWLKTLQRPDGSFGEVVRPDGVVSGGRDMRYCYMAAATRWILRGHEAGPELVLPDGVARACPVPAGGVTLVEAETGQPLLDILALGHGQGRGRARPRARQRRAARDAVGQVADAQRVGVGRVVGPDDLKVSPEQERHSFGYPHRQFRFGPAHIAIQHPYGLLVVE